MDIRIASKLDEFEFIENCMNQDEFKKYIGEFKSLKNVMIFYHESKFYGICFPNIQESGDMQISCPIVYMKKKYDKKNSWFLVNSIYYIFKKFVKVEKMEFIIYSHNSRSKNLMLNFNIECEGKLKGGVKIDNQILDVYYYTVSKTDLEKWKEFFNGKFIYN